VDGSQWNTEDAPYWQRHYGIGRPWQTRPSVRRGCVLALVGVLAVVTLLLIVALVAALVG
jgi:hypothetical protein